ncbi:hypothetical protein DL93DRAFT_1326267 [Clavulina sp. PMI_390]|nr:hypothetical protein DL93DRAFT_1326267 [Clavulina sp. PMI_390]
MILLSGGSGRQASRRRPSVGTLGCPGKEINKNKHRFGLSSARARRQLPLGQRTHTMSNAAKREGRRPRGASVSEALHAIETDPAHHLAGPFVPGRYGTASLSH